MLGNTHLWLKSKTKNLIISLYKSAVHHIWSAALSFGLPASTEMLHKLGKGHRDDQELRSCYCAQEGPTKKNMEGRKQLLSTTHTWRIEKQPNFKKYYCVQMKLWNLVVYYDLRAKIMELMNS